MNIRGHWHKVFVNRGIDAIEIRIASESSWDTSLLRLKYTKGRMEIVSKPDNIEDETALFAKLDSRKPVCLIIQGKGILTKKVFCEDGEDINQLLIKALPNAFPNDFYIHVSGPNNNEKTITIARKSLIDGILRKFKQNKFEVIELFLGYHTLKNLLPLLENPPQRVAIGEKVYTLNAGSLTSETIPDEERSANVYTYSGVEVNENELPALSAGLSFLIGQRGQCESPIEDVQYQWKDNIYGRVFKLLGIGFLVFCLLILLLNFFAFDHYNKKLGELSAQANMVNAQLSHFETLQKQLSQKQQLLEKSGLEEISRFSFYLDRIAGTVPVGLTLSRLNANPRLTKLRSSDIDFNKNRVVVHGNTNNGIQLNEWVKKLRDFDWVESVQISEYIQQPTKQMAEFKLQLSIKH